MRPTSILTSLLLLSCSPLYSQRAREGRVQLRSLAHGYEPTCPADLDV